MRIGIIGAGAVGGALARHWTRAGHELLLASRHPERLRGRDLPLASRHPERLAGRAGTPREAAAFAETVLLAVPFWEIDEALALAGPLDGRLVLDATNPYEPGFTLAPTRLGSAAADLQAKLPRATVVKAFNALDAGQLDMGGGGRIGALCFADDEAAYARAAALVRDATFVPVFGGGLARAALGEAGGPLHGMLATAEELASALGD